MFETIKMYGIVLGTVILSKSQSSFIYHFTCSGCLTAGVKKIISEIKTLAAMGRRFHDHDSGQTALYPRA